MSVAPEEQPPSDTPPAYQSVAIASPYFEIDESAPAEISQTLQNYEAWLVGRPAIRSLGLHRFAANPNAASAASPWRYLTDRIISHYYHFDEVTEGVIRADSDIQDFRNDPSVRRNDTDLAQQLRVKRLELFMRQARLAKKLGREAITDK